MPRAHLWSQSTAPGAEPTPGQCDWMFLPHCLLQAPIRCQKGEAREIRGYFMAGGGTKFGKRDLEVVPMLN